jgi:superfamily I DNA and/or RNA helicase
MSSFKDILVDLTDHSSYTNRRDLLLEVSAGPTFPLHSKNVLTFPMHSLLLKIIEQARKEEKESGILPLCIAENSLTWDYRSQTLCSPLVLYPCVAHYDKVRMQIELEPRDDKGFVNPMLLRMLKIEYDLMLSDEPESIVSELHNAGFNQVDTVLLLGNFHHHRFDVLRDLEALRSVPVRHSLEELFGEKEPEQGPSLSLDDAVLEACDPDQLGVLNSVQRQNTVVQGPPGTGKSQLLTNLLAKTLLSKSTALVVSEKRAALDVLIKRLSNHNLDRFVFAVTDSRQSKELLADLKDTWLLLEQGSTLSPNTYKSASMLLANFQLLLNTLNSSQAVGGLTYAEFIAETKDLDLSIGNYDSELPTVKRWLHQESLVCEIYKKQLNDSLGSMHFSILQSDQIRQIDRTLAELSKEHNRLSQLLSLVHWKDLLEAMKLAAAAQYFSSNLYRQYATLMKHGSKEQRKFLRLRKKYLKISHEMEISRAEDSNWHRKPTAEELIMLQREQSRGGFLSKYHFRRLWSVYSSIPPEQSSSMMGLRFKELNIQEELNQCKMELLDLGIERVEVSLEIVYQMILSYPVESEKKISKLAREKVQLLASSNKALLDLHTQLKLVFRFREEVVINELLTTTRRRITDVLNLFATKPEYSEEIHRVLGRYPSFEQLREAVFFTNYQRSIQQYPYLKELKACDLLTNCTEIINAQDREARDLVSEILGAQREKFESYLQLLRTPVNKLTLKEKEFKIRLKRGKSILVKAFSKKRNLPSLRTLMHSEAAEWIRILKPIWLSSPLLVARIFPLEKELFTFGIFDEASQIPVENALGTIYRSQRSLVAGDSQQMPPSNFFNSGIRERTDLLHQASFHWESLRIKYHYRSEHPGLIHFSNRHFYNDGLLAFPSLNSEENPIELHFIEGLYQNATNLIEARAVAKELERQLCSLQNIGVVAFSRSQLDTIFSSISPSASAEVDKRIAQGTLFFKALENVQGEECDVLIVSMGYGKDKEGKFHLRFGPLNQSGGDKRLNVLFSRARKKIHLFASVKSSDFKLSSNETIDLLRLYLKSAENEDFKAVKDAFFQKYKITRNGNELIIKSPQQTLPEALQMVTFIRVLSKRGWQLKLEF